MSTLLRAVTIFAISNFLVFIAFSTTTLASQYDAELLKLTNIERQKVGLSAFTLSSQLGKAAQSHAEDMAKNNYFSHTGLNGSKPSDRAKAAGYNYSYVGENIAAGNSTPAHTIQQWMNSKGHRENILSSNYTEIGFGYAYEPSSPYRYYWVQVFGKSRGGSTPTPQPTPQPTQTTLEQKSNAIFNIVEKKYPQYFFPATKTQFFDSGTNAQYFRFYNNQYQAALAIHQNHLWYALDGKWSRFITLEQANKVICNNKCWN